MSRTFSLAEARELMPEVLSRAEELIDTRASLMELQAALAAGAASPLGGLPEAKGFQARLAELVGWYADAGLEVKGIAPLLLDFPSQRDGEQVLLCWLEGERELGWYHPAAYGFAGGGGSRRRRGRKAESGTCPSDPPAATTSRRSRRFTSGPGRPPTPG